MSSVFTCNFKTHQWINSNSDFCDQCEDLNHYYCFHCCIFPLQDVRDSIQSTSSAEDDIYERLSLKSLSSPSGVASPVDGETDTKNEVSFFPSPPKTPQESTGTGIYVTARPGSFRASAGKGKLSTGWLAHFLPLVTFKVEYK